MKKRDFFESTFGQVTDNDVQVSNLYNRLQESYGSGLANDVSSIFKSKDSAQAFLESINGILEEDEYSGTGLASSILKEDAQARSVAMGAIMSEILTESTQQGLAALRPISLTSFGIQMRAYTKAVMHRAVKTIQAEKPSFKLTERKQFLIDINGNKRYFKDAFNFDSTVGDNLSKKFDFTVTVPSTTYDIFASNSIDTRNKLAIDVVLKSFGAVESDGTTPTNPSSHSITSKLRNIDLETGRFSFSVKFGADDATATIYGEFDFNSNKVVGITSTSDRVKDVTFTGRLSNETHLASIVVGFEHEHSLVTIPDGDHIEVEMSQEYTDDAARMLGVNLLEEYTNQMATAVERFEDIKIYNYLKGLEDQAILKDVEFDITPAAGFALGKEEWIKREFHPFIERICIRLKSELQIDDCHFRVVGNPIDVRLPNSSEESYIFRRNQDMSGNVKVNYDFAVMSSANTVFYLSTERVKPGRMYVLLIPNSIENNISTINHYRYANYVTNKYRSSRNPALPTVMVSSRYKTQEYLPVMATIKITNNFANFYSGLYS